SSLPASGGPSPARSTLLLLRGGAAALVRHAGGLGLRHVDALARGRRGVALELLGLLVEGAALGAGARFEHRELRALAGQERLLVHAARVLAVLVARVVELGDRVVAQELDLLLRRKLHHPAALRAAAAIELLHLVVDAFEGERLVRRARVVADEVAR